MKTILVPTDFSECAAGALDFASMLVKRIPDSKIVLLHVWELPAPVAEVPFELLKLQKEELRQKSSGDLESLASSKRKEGLSLTTLLLEGDPEASLLNAIREQQVSLVVMGTLGNTGLGTEIFGTTASHILEKAACPVLAVPPVAAGMQNIHKITYATDYNTADIAAIEQLVELAKAFHAQLNILHVAGQSIGAKEEKSLMKDFMSKVNEAVTYNNFSFQVIQGANPQTELQGFIDSEATDMIVLSTHKRSWFEKIFGISITREIALNSAVPVMAFHITPSKPFIF